MITCLSLSVLSWVVGDPSVAMPSVVFFRCSRFGFGGGVCTLTSPLTSGSAYNHTRDTTLWKNWCTKQLESVPIYLISIHLPFAKNVVPKMLHLQEVRLGTVSPYLKLKYLKTILLCILYNVCVSPPSQLGCLGIALVPRMWVSGFESHMR